MAIKKEESNLYKFISEAAKSSGLKTELGSGFSIDLKEKILNPTMFLKIKIVENNRFDIGAFVSASQDFGGMIGVRVGKTSMKINLGVCANLASKIKLNDINSYKGFMGISFKI